MFVVADYIPFEARRYAAGINYRGRLSPEGDRFLLPDQCPLGAVLQSLDAGDWDFPTAEQFAQSLVASGECRRPEDGTFAIEDAADDFISAWENGDISDLWEALGATDPNQTELPIGAV